MYDAIRDFVAILEQNLNRTTSLYIVKECSNVKSNFWYKNVQLAVNFVKGIAASALVAVLFEKTEKTRQQLFVCWKFTACCL